MTTVKADVEQELRADELRQILSEQQKELDSLKDSITEAGHNIEKEVGLEEINTSTSEAVAEFNATLADVADEPSSAAQVVEETASVKPAVKKSTAKKPAAKKAATKKSVAKKSAPKKPSPPKSKDKSVS
jgi:hypothetical protein